METVLVCLMLLLVKDSADSRILVDAQAKDVQIRELQRRGLIRECKRTVLGLEYMGKMSRTISGKSCQRWTSNYPHEHGYHGDHHFPEGSEQAASNFCRNPKYDAVKTGPWCYTTDAGKRWEACPVPFCSDIVFHVDLRGGSPLTNEGRPRRVPYDHVNMNVDQVYKVALHAFVAPQPGVYMFMVDGFSSSEGPGCIQLRKNNVVTDHAYTAGGFSSMSISMPLQLKKGDTVFVNMCPSVRNTLDTNGRNSFTGHLLTQTL